jgi:tRNA (guanine37-N1)-methyltransferase
MRFDIVSLFPESLESYCEASIIKRAKIDGKIAIFLHQLRDWATDKHKITDDTPYGGGAGMVMKVEPFHRCLESIFDESSKLQYPRTRVILLSAKGKRFVQADAARFAQYDRLIFLCGRYEGVDERVALHLTDEEVSIGDFVLTGGELPAMMIVDAVARLLPGVLGNALSTVTESFSDGATREYPQYTKPEVYHDWVVPPVLLSGNHAAIDAWRKDQTTNTHSQEYGDTTAY